MDEKSGRRIVIAGGGIAGLTAALAFARRGFAVSVFERAPRIDDAGAGVQLSPNATRVLDRLGALGELLPVAVKPETVVLRDAASLKELARVPLGDFAERRWKAPYLVAHRADLQAALLTVVAQHSGIELTLGATVRDVVLDGSGVTAFFEIAGVTREAAGMLLVGADGVWSTARAAIITRGTSKFTGLIAWRATMPANSEAADVFASAGSRQSVTAFLHPHAHLVAYPMRGGEAVNLVAVTKGGAQAEGYSGPADPSILARWLSGAAPSLRRLVADGAWTTWPIHVADRSAPWTADNRLALIGDAAHAMTPFAAQGAAMAIEDAETLAAFVAAAPESMAGALAAWEQFRRPRAAKVIRRGALNRLAWHAAGPVAVARDLFLRMRGPDKLAADLDWLYGWDFSDWKKERRH